MQEIRYQGSVTITPETKIGYATFRNILNDFFTPQFEEFLIDEGLVWKERQTFDQWKQDLDDLSEQWLEV